MSKYFPYGCILMALVGCGIIFGMGSISDDYRTTVRKIDGVWGLFYD